MRTVIHFLHHEKEITKSIEITRKRNVWFIIDFQIMDDVKEGLRCQHSHVFWPLSALSFNREIRNLRLSSATGLIESLILAGFAVRMFQLKEIHAEALTFNS